MLLQEDYEDTLRKKAYSKAFEVEFEPNKPTEEQTSGFKPIKPRMKSLGVSTTRSSARHNKNQSLFDTQRTTLATPSKKSSPFDFGRRSAQTSQQTDPKCNDWKQMMPRDNKMYDLSETQNMKRIDRRRHQSRNNLLLAQ